MAGEASNQAQRLYEIQVEEKQENKAENWKAFDQTLEIKRIFLRSHTNLHAKCKDSGLSAKQTYLSQINLYLSLVDVLLEYENKIVDLILQGNDFDKSEFIMVINCMHGSVDYLNNIFKMYEDEIFFRLPTEMETERQNGEF